MRERQATPNHDNMDLLSNEEQCGELTINSSVGNIQDRSRGVPMVGKDTPNFDQREKFKKRQEMMIDENGRVFKET
jgi:hypothetical protein